MLTQSISKKTEVISDFGLSKLSDIESNVHIEEGITVSGGWWTKIPPQNEVSHFENLQSTNWNTLRFKSPPSVESDIGWRVEFRPLDIQLTDFENAAFTVFVGMIVNVINEFSLDFILPVSYVD